MPPDVSVHVIMTIRALINRVAQPCSKIYSRKTFQMNAANIYIGSMLVLVSTVILSINTYILLLIGRNYRFAAFKYPTPSSGANGQRSQPKGPYILHHLPTCYFLSLSVCFALRLLLTVAHNGPTLILGDLFAGASVSGLAGWLYKCSYYGAMSHVIVLCIHKYALLSGYKKRRGRDKGKRHVIFGSRFRMRFITFLIWLPPILISTVIKMKLCEWQFSPEHLTYECAEIITKSLGYGEQNSRSSKTETLFNYQIEWTKILKIVDTVLLILCSLFCIFCVIRVLILLKKRTRQVTQVQSSVSVISSSSNQPFRSNRNLASSTSTHIAKDNRHIRQLIAICFLFLVANLLDFCLNLLNFDRTSVNLAHYIWTNLIYSFLLPFFFIFYSKHRLLQNGLMCLSKTGLGAAGDKRSASFAGSNTSNGTVNWGGGATKKYKSPFSNIMSSRSPSPNGPKPESGEITSISMTDHHSPQKLNVERLSNYRSFDRSPEYPTTDQTSKSNLFVPQTNCGLEKEISIKDQQSIISDLTIENDPQQTDSGTFRYEQQSPVDFAKKKNLLERRTVDQKRLPPIRLNAFEMEKIGSSQDESPTPDIIGGQSVLTNLRRKRLFMGPVQANMSQESAVTIFQTSHSNRRRTAENQSLATCVSPAESMAEKFTDTLSKYNPPLFVRNENFQPTTSDHRHHGVFVQQPSMVGDYSSLKLATNAKELERKVKKSRHFMNGFLTND